MEQLDQGVHWSSEERRPINRGRQSRRHIRCAVTLPLIRVLSVGEFKSADGTWNVPATLFGTDFCPIPPGHGAQHVQGAQIAKQILL